MGQWLWIILDTNSKLHFAPHHTKILVKSINFPEEEVAFLGFVRRLARSLAPLGHLQNQCDLNLC
jgi:hypothetical protein